MVIMIIIDPLLQAEQQEIVLINMAREFHTAVPN
jgi:hypothetical protein